MYSFDIFDTLLFRKVNRPVQIFNEVEKRLEKKTSVDDYAYLRRLSEENANSCFDKVEITLDDIYFCFQKHTAIDSKLLEEIKQIEVQVEKENTYLNGDMVDKLKRHKEVGERVVLISDMYLPEHVIRDILVEKDPVFSEVPIYVSSEYNCSKADGLLFKIVKDREKSEYTEWKHYGDNVFSDYLVPKALGIDAHIVCQTQKEDLEETDDLFIDEPDFSDSNGSVENEIGYHVGAPLLYGYVKWIIHLATQQNYKRLLFIARDGYILKKIADNYIRLMNIHNLETIYLYSSRDAWRVTDKKEVESVKGYFFQEITQLKPDDLFVDLQGTGTTLEFISDIFEKKINAVYFNILKFPDTSKCNVYSYDGLFPINIELFGRAPHGKTIGYSKDGQTFIPILVGNGNMSESYKIYMDETIEAANKFCLYEKNIKEIDFRKVIFKLKDKGLGLLKKENAVFYGNIIQGDGENDERVFAPQLSPVKYLNIVYGREKYKGYSLLISKARMSEDEQHTCDVLEKEYLDSIKNNSLHAYDKTKTNMIIYGAGKIGKRVLGKYTEKTEINVLSWVDLNSERYKKSGYPVSSIDEALNMEYDLWVISIGGKNEHIKPFLVECGVNERKIVYWNEIE